jgi:hypothetical protein
MLQCMSQMVQACNSLYQPPPAIAMNQAQMCNDEFLRHGRTTTQLRKCAAEFRNIADNYLKLAQSAFDADPKTLANVRMYAFKFFSVNLLIISIICTFPAHCFPSPHFIRLKNMALLMAQSIECMVFTNHQDRDLIDFG